MMTNGRDPLTSALRGLAAQPARDLRDLVFASWLRTGTPRLGDVYVAFTGAGISYLRTAESMHDDDTEFTAAFRREFGRPLRKVDSAPPELLAALAGKPDTVDFDLGGLTDFERDVLAATRRIPLGQTRPYGWVAAEIGRPRAVRAVGTALARNPVPLLIPCHRVIRSNGELGQYVFGAQVKERLLRAEKADLAGAH